MRLPAKEKAIKDNHRFFASALTHNYSTYTAYEVLDTSN